MRTVDLVNTAEKRKTILLAATKCFARLGIQGTSISNICEETGMRTGHLYYYFSGKDEIIKSVFELILERNADRIEHMLDSENFVSAIIKVHELAEADRREWGVTPGLRMEFSAEAVRNERLGVIGREHIKRQSAALTRAIRKALAEGQLDPQFSALDYTNAVLLIWNGLSGMRLYRDFDLTKYAQAIEMLLRPKALQPRNRK